MDPRHPANARLDLVTPLPLEDCLKALKRCAAQNTVQRLSVHAEDGQVLIVSSTQRGRDGQAAGLWLFRFQGCITPTDIGTHVEGFIVRNRVLESVLAVPGIVTGLFGVVGIALNVPFVAVLSPILLVMLAGFYGYFQTLVRRQADDLMRWLPEWLLVPQGRAGGALP